MYNVLVSGLKSAADCSIPIMHQNALKCWWTHDAQELKELAIESHRAWINVNKPKNGLIFDLMKTDKYKYKLFLKKLQNDQRGSTNDSLLSSLIA